jgi:dUTP pyrophosphatase
MSKVTKIKIVVKEGGTAPKKSTEGAAGYDFYSPVDFTVPASQNVRGTAAVAIGRFQVDTLIAIQVPVNMVGNVKGRSGLAFNQGMDAFSGTIDSDFTGTVKVLLYNFTGRPIDFKKGDRIGQIVFEYAPAVELEETDKLDETVRGEGGLGHTGA